MGYFGEPKMRCHWQILLLLPIVSLYIIQVDSQQQQQQQAPVVVQDVKTKVIVPNLPPNHYQFWLKNHAIALERFKQLCKQVSHPLDLNHLEHFQSLHANLSLEDLRYMVDLDYGKKILHKICSKIDDVKQFCWGYEQICNKIYLMPECDGTSLDPPKSEQEQKITWFNQADFGYILNRRREMQMFCGPDLRSNVTVRSSLQCSKYFRTCRGENLMMRFNNIPKTGSLITNHKSGLMKKGDVGGWNCDLQTLRIQEEKGHSGPLQSWFNELENYDKLNVDPSRGCELTINKTAFIIKLDSTGNMYHYFCSFLNLYATMHLNNRFSDDINIIIWDNQSPRSKFEQMWHVFSKNPLTNIGEYEGKSVCFKNFKFTLLPRMIDGLYYGTQLIPGCYKSGLFHAFNRHVLHKLNISQDLHRGSENKIIRITIVSRSTPYRRILNLGELEGAMKNKSIDYQVKIIDYNEMDFLDQLKVTQNTDILMGIHGAGLTHSLFLPDWAALFELYDCSDKCYHDLARLRGVDYYTQKSVVKLAVNDKVELERLKERKLVDYEKFSNYKVDVNEFLDTLERAVEKVRKNRSKYFEDLENPRSSTAENANANIEVTKPETSQQKTKHHEEL